MNSRSTWLHRKNLPQQMLNPKCPRPLPMLSAESSILGLILYLASSILPDSMCSHRNGLEQNTTSVHHQLQPFASVPVLATND